MSLYKIEDVIAESRPGYTRADILSMPFYEFMLKLDIMKDRADEREKREKSESDKHSKMANPAKYGQMKTPKLPYKFK